eukprot:TRINITY_DN24734_c0_g1_i1.p1 TRINITY_DN24734_c0_g1~~TRINITY_DN24734_c0_g1_i1.p1  ORF type:complete len:589 (+),score=172.93 TRINITY_DN24734_c0_g1_i1:67-1833(+)
MKRLLRVLSAAAACGVADAGVGWCLGLNCGPKVRTDAGVVQGRYADLEGTLTYHGIPFAAPPVGENRWKPPQPVAPWEGTRQATLAEAHQCAQFDLVRGVRLGQEDCLYLSVYSPKQCTPATPCPVMQWIHGGAWVLGSNFEFGFYDATKLAERYGVVVVGGNYRLDALGFLSLDELRGETANHTFGNYGLLDQLAAMKWTRRNVLAFGGDPGRVTLFGESAGGFSVCQHLVMPASNGLFSHAIMESGDCDGPWMIHPSQPARAWGDAYATYLGCPPGEGRLACLRALSLEDALVPYLQQWMCAQPVHQGRLDPWCNKTHTGTRWPLLRPPMAPVVGFTVVVDGVLLPKVPYQLIKDGAINTSPTGEPVSVIFGSNKDELALFVATMPFVVQNVTLPFSKDDMSIVADHLASYHSNWGDAEAAKIVAAYPRDAYATGNLQIVRAGTDFTFACGTRDAARALSDHGLDVYLYEYAYEGNKYIDPANPLCSLDAELLCGVYHGDEVAFVFQRNTAFSPAMDRFARAVGGYWTNMAKTGSPNGAGLVPWPKFTTATDAHLLLADPIKASAGYRKETCDFWDTLPKETPYPT